jgi:hypothetical protein
MPQEKNPQRPERESFWTRRKRISRQSAAERQHLLRERDLERGYRVNVKQVVLAFAVEFVIIGLILTGQFVYAVQLPNISRFVIVQTLLFPIALAMVELARVPLALAVRIQKSWNIQLAALLGVACAVVVTSASLYQIGNLTFNPRLEAVHEKQQHIDAIQDRRNTAIAQRKEAQDQLDQRNSEYSVLSDRYKSLVTQLNAQPNQNCLSVPTTAPDGSASAKPFCRDNPALKPLRTEIDGTKAKLNESDALVKQAQANVTKLDSHSIDNELSNAQKEYRDAVFQSPLHSYTGMLFNKDPKDVSEGEVKTLEWYLILIPSIAAALSSTLIAMTAVHRIKPPKAEPSPIMPDEALTFLLGPLVQTLKQEVKNTVAEAMKKT